MQIFLPRETCAGERRVPMVPTDIERLVKLGADVVIEAGMGSSCYHYDEAYEQAGAQVSGDRDRALAEADMVLRVNKPPLEEVTILKDGCIHVSFLDPFSEHGLIDEMVSCRISAICMEMIPRITRAQKMDALSSQANLAGYAAVIIAAERLDKIFPMMMTAAGTLTPARVFVIGAGVAGLQAIATAKRLGARVEAFDTRPVVEEQVLSLGAKFVKVDLDETGQTEGGYAKELTVEQQELERQTMAKVCAQSDVVITTAKVFGRLAPLIVTNEMIEQMKPGSVIVDLAVETGGNVECSELDEELEMNGVRIVGLGNLPAHVAIHASQMYSTNIAALIQEFWNEDMKRFKLDLEDEIIKGCLVTHKGEITNEMIREAHSKISA